MSQDPEEIYYEEVKSPICNDGTPQIVDSLAGLFSKPSPKTPIIAHFTLMQSTANLNSMDLGEDAEVTMQDYAEKYATETNFKTMNTNHFDLFRTTSVPKIKTMIESTKTRNKPKGMLFNFDMMIKGAPQSIKRECIMGDTPSCIDMNTLEECSMFVNSMTKIENINE